MAPIPILSILTYSTSSPHNILKVSRQIIDHNLPVGWDKRDDWVLGGTKFWIYVGFPLVFVTTILLSRCWCKIINWMAIYCQYFDLIAYYISVIVPAHVVLNVILSTLTKYPSLHAFLARMYKNRSPCIQNIWSSQNCSKMCMKDVCQVLGCDSNAKWSVGAAKGWEATANKLMAICYQNTMSD